MILTVETELLGGKHYTAWVVDEWMSMEHWWNDTDRGNWSTGRKTLYSVGGRWMNEYGALVEWYWQGKLKYREKNLSKWHSSHLKSHMDCWDRMLTSSVRVRRLTAWHMWWQTFRYDAVTQQSVLRVLSGHSLTFQQWQFLQLAILAYVKSRRTLSPVFLDVWRTWIFDLIDLSWGRNVGSWRELLLLWLLLRLRRWGWLCGVGVGVGLYLQTERAALQLVCICRHAKRKVPCAQILWICSTLCT